MRHLSSGITCLSIAAWTEEALGTTENSNAKCDERRDRVLVSDPIYCLTMNDQSWRLCLQTCRRILGFGDWDAYLSESWCAFTTHSSLTHGTYYFNCGFPAESECLDTHTADGGVWRQSFRYDDLAHLVVPKTFYWERTNEGFQSGYKEQDIRLLSGELKKLGIQHRLTDLLLEIKLY